MIFYSNNIKKTSASFFMMLFVFVQTVKTFHSHNYSFSTQYKSDAPKKVSLNSNCAVCDFQLAKDSDVAITSIYISAPAQYIFSYYYSPVSKLATTLKKFSSRGPPVSI